MGLFQYARGLLADVVARYNPSILQPSNSLFSARRALFAECWAAYGNTRYNKQGEQGQREIIQERLRDLSTENLDGFFAFPERVANAFADIMDGPFGVRIDVEQNVPEAEQPVKDPLRNAIKSIWDWSNFDVQLPKACLECAVTGNEPLRIVVRPGKSRPVVIRPESPSWIRQLETDADRNVTDVELEYEVVEGSIGDPTVSRGDDRSRNVLVEEYLGKDRFWMKRDGKIVYDRKNPLGVCPYVLMRHKDTGDEFGQSSFVSSLIIMDAINALVSHTAYQVKNSVYVQWVGTGPGEPPLESTPFGPYNLVWIRNDGSPGASTLVPMVAPLNLEQCTNFIEMLIDELKKRHPETYTSDSKFLSNQSGETIAQLRLPAEVAKRRAAVQYEFATKRALQIALSFGVMQGEWDLGKGMGSVDSENVEAAEASFRSGAEDFRFGQRDLLPRSQSELAVIRKNNAEAWLSETTAATNCATLGSLEYGLRTLVNPPGESTDEQIEAIKKEAGDETGIYAAKAKAQARVLNRGGGEIVQESALKPGQPIKPIGDVTGAKRDSGV